MSNMSPINYEVPVEEASISPNSIGLGQTHTDSAGGAQPLASRSAAPRVSRTSPRSISVPSVPPILPAASTAPATTSVPVASTAPTTAPVQNTRVQQSSPPRDGIGQARHVKDPTARLSTNAYFYKVSTDKHGKRHISVDALPSTLEGKRELAATLVACALAEGLTPLITVSFEDPDMSAALYAYLDLVGLPYTDSTKSAGANWFNSKNKNSSFEAVVDREREAVIAREVGEVKLPGMPPQRTAEANFVRRFFQGPPDPTDPQCAQKLAAARACRTPIHSFLHNVGALFTLQPFNSQKRIDKRTVVRYYDLNNQQASPNQSQRLLREIESRGALFALDPDQSRSAHRLESVCKAANITGVGKTQTPAQFLQEMRNRVREPRPRPAPCA